ncbi:MAG: hypothetical protein FVQ77_02020 [Cytophagales bacterium]|nr:hypothetical protein [Cytophagales bacterium]
MKKIIYHIAHCKLPGGVQRRSRLVETLHATSLQVGIAFFFFIAYCQLPTVNCFSQSLRELQDEYLIGKQLLKTEKYKPAMAVFDFLTRDVKDNPFVPYAHYFYALSAFKLEKYDTASQKLTMLIKKYPRWNKIGEVHYLLANVFLETKQYEKAIRFINKCDFKSDLLEDINSMKWFYLDQVESRDAQFGRLYFLKSLQAKYMDDRILARVLANKLSWSIVHREDKILLEYLIQEYDFDRQDFNLWESGKGAHKESYNVAVMFPFKLSNLDHDNPHPNNQFVYDLFDGVLFAVNTLAKSGININVFAYDTEKDINKLVEILNLDEIKVMDLIIGPLYRSTSQAAMNFAQQYQINIINPLSNNPILIENNPYAFLFEPSSETQARVAADYASDNFMSDTAVIIYGSTNNDSIMAYTYKELLEQDSVVINVFEKVNNKSAMKIREIIGNINHNNGGHIFVASADQIIAASVMSALEISNTQITLFTLSDWLDHEVISYDQLKLRNTHFIYPDYVGLHDDKTKTFTYKYLNKNNRYPSKYAFKGYELMLNFGKLLYDYGNYFQDSLYTAGYTKGALLPGFDYSWVNDNQYVPILKFDDEFRLELLNPASEE